MLLAMFIQNIKLGKNLIVLDLSFLKFFICCIKRNMLCPFFDYCVVWAPSGAMHTRHLHSKCISSLLRSHSAVLAI